MPTAIDVARYLLHLALQEPDEPECMTNLRLQKLLYYVQGWSLATRGRPMFAESLEAWRHGPVVESVYHGFKRYGKAVPIPKREARSDKLGEPDRAFVASVWEAYKKFSSIELRNMTHREGPWRDAWEKCQQGRIRNEVIPQQRLEQQFSIESQRARLAIPAGLEHERIEKARHDLEAGRGIGLDALLAEIGA